MGGGADDLRWMAQALALAARGAGRTAPNPMVGCIVVNGGSVVGRGYHKATGRRHAEAIALAEAGGGARGATLYVNLEPCAHHGRTPPCTEQVVASGIARVVAAVQDPDPRVDGRGFGLLRTAGIEVVTGVLEAEARRLNGAFFHWHTHGEPLVTLKAAVSADGHLAAAAGSSRWISGPASRRFAHHLRSIHGAILVGAGTARTDDPSLEVRLPGPAVSRPKVVVSSSLELDSGAKIFQGPSPVWVYTIDGCEASRRDDLARVAEVISVSAVGGEVDLTSVLSDLGRRGVQSVLVEGGGRIHASLVSLGLAHRVALFRSGKLLGARGATPLLDMTAAASPAVAPRMVVRRTLRLGADLCEWGEMETGGGTV